MPPKTSQTDIKITTLVSIGRHPLSGRMRRADQDARALEMALKLSPNNHQALHAGDVNNATLRDYAGMGLERLQVLNIAEDDDASEALITHLQQQHSDIILCGVRAESGEGSGMLPYLLAEDLGCPIVAHVADIVAINAGVADVLIALPRGQRRAIKVALPFIATIDPAAQPSRQSAYGPAKRATLETLTATHKTDQARTTWKTVEAKPRAKRLKVTKAKTAAQRFKAATAKPQGEAGKVMIEQTAEEKAQAIFDMLLDEGVIS